MASTEAPISITVKTAAGSLVTVRAESGAELDQVVALSLASLSSAVHELEAAVKPNNTAVPPNPQMAAIATSFGATDVVTHTAPFVPAAYANVTDGQRVCPHGTMTRIHGLTGKFGPYKGHFCPAKQGDPTKCTTIYVKAGSPEFASFMADQTKA
jgi:Zn-dependent alcohol dehydrogenase